MGKKGKTQQVGATTTAPEQKDFQGSGVEGKKGADTPPADDAAPETSEPSAGDTPPAEEDATDTPSNPADAAGSDDESDDSADPATDGEVVAEPEVSPVSEMVTGEDVLKRLREQGHRV